MTNQKREPGVEEGIREGRQDKKQDDVARERPALKDLEVHDDHSKRPRPSKQRGD